MMPRRSRSKSTPHGIWVDVVVAVVVSPPDVPVPPPLGDGEGVGPGVGEGVRDGQNWGEIYSPDLVIVPCPTVCPSLMSV